MCDLAAVNASKPTTMAFTLLTETGRQQSRSNRHGWGLAFYPVADREGSGQLAAEIHKAPELAGHSPLFKAARHAMTERRSQTFILHFRQTAGASVSYRNTHPFERELWGHSFVLAHNGGIASQGRVVGTGFEPVGGTGSEKILCGVLNHLRDAVGSGQAYRALTPNDRAKQIHAAINATLPRRENEANLLITDGDILVAHSRYAGNAMHYQERGPGFASDAYQGAETNLRLQATKANNESAVFVVTGTSNPGGAPMKAVPHGESLFVHNGRIIGRTWVEDAEATVQEPVLNLPGVKEGEFRVYKAPRTTSSKVAQMYVGSALAPFIESNVHIGKVSVQVLGVEGLTSGISGILARMRKGDRVILMNERAREAVSLVGAQQPWRLTVRPA